jgi:phage shock protein E
MKKLLPLLIIVVACSSPDSRNSANYLLGPEAFGSKIQHGATLIDVRTVEEYAGGHISGSLNMDINNEGFKENVLMLDRSKEYVLYCASGVRSGKAADIMRQSGFTSVYTLAGGMKLWRDKGFPVE